MAFKEEMRRLCTVERIGFTGDLSGFDRMHAANQAEMLLNTLNKVALELGFYPPFMDRAVKAVRGGLDQLFAERDAARDDARKLFDQRNKIADAYRNRFNGEFNLTPEERKILQHQY